LIYLPTLEENEGEDIEETEDGPTKKNIEEFHVVIK